MSFLSLDPDSPPRSSSLPRAGATSRMPQIGPKSLRRTPSDPIEMLERVPTPSPPPPASVELARSNSSRSVKMGAFTDYRMNGYARQDDDDDDAPIETLELPVVSPTLEEATPEEMAGIRLSIHSASDWDGNRSEEYLAPFPVDKKPHHLRPPNLDLSKTTPLIHSLAISPSLLSPSDTELPESPEPPPEKKKPSIQPTFALLFSLNSRSTTLGTVIPAIGFAVLCGLVPPYMTEVSGVAFQAFSTYTIATFSDPTPEILAAARTELLRSTRISAIQFCALAGAILITSTASIGLWVVNGERVVKALRKEVFRGVGARELEWFDLGMGATAEEHEGDDSEGGAGAAGLMARFARETDNVRMATSQTLGLIITYVVSFFACLGLSFYRDALLTIVILSSIPIIIIIVAITEKLAAPLTDIDRDFAAKCAGRADRILGAMPTIKAFNAEVKESDLFNSLNGKAFVAYCKLHMVWGIRGGGTQFVLLTMFVQGFWFGSYLVTSGRSTPAAVNTCFWATLLASTYLQLCIPMLIGLEKGKIGMADLLEMARGVPLSDIPVPIAQDIILSPVSSPRASVQMLSSTAWKEAMRKGSLEGAEPFALRGITNSASLTPLDERRPDLPRSPSSPMTPIFLPLPNLVGNQVMKRRRGAAPRALRKLRPSTFSGEMSLRNVTFHYPSRPHPSAPALDNVSLYLAAKETTYIVGGSGSGKSTVGNLLLGLYRPESGRIEVDEQGIEWIDDEWLRGHVGCVSQGASVIFDGTVHDNIAIGVVGQIREDGTRRSPTDVPREEVIEACRSALVHEFIRDLPEGYDTFLSGEKGASLSGGQRQRLAIARAWIRDPTVLILDEATSALDATSRLLVSEAVKLWRKNKTTIIITHDLSPIDPTDFVYVMTNGAVVEQGYRRDLEANVGGTFHTLAGIQASEADEPRNVEAAEDSDEDSVEVLDYEITDDPYYANSIRASTRASTRRPSLSSIEEPTYPIPSARRPSVFINTALFTPSADFLARQTREFNDVMRASANFATTQEDRRSTHTTKSSRRQTQVDMPPVYDYSAFGPLARRGSDSSFVALDVAAKNAAARRPGGRRIKHNTMMEGDAIGKEWSTMQRRDAAASIDHIAIEVEGGAVIQMSIIAMIRKFYPTLPNKPLFWTGIASSVAVGAATPVFSSLLAKLMASLGTPNAGNIVVSTSLLILLVAVLDGFFTFLKFYTLERAAMGWIVSLRANCLALVIKQDKAFFDRPENSTSSLAYILIKDAEDARTLVGTIIGQMFVVFSMIALGLGWAFVVGWELTLVGLGLAPVFIVATRLQASIIAKLEIKNKRMREDVSKKFHQVASNIRAIRAMSIESVFVAKFDEAIDKAYIGGARAAPFAGFGLGLGSALTYVAQALMFYVGAVLIVNGRYTFVKMIEVFTLVVFSVTFSSQIMTYLPQMTKSIRAGIDLTRLMDLESETQESQGRMTFPISGAISFDNVIFSYPSRPHIPILKGMSFEIKPGECVGIVGASGSGKSTVASLLQRLYEPTLGEIRLDGRSLNRMDVRYLRDHTAVVSQHPALFDMTISENIAYGPIEISQDEIVAAAKAAHVHEFIMTLPKGYATMLGENASLISGGQAQRLQIARALVRHRELLILDECTSALDSQNRASVMETIMEARGGQTTAIITHDMSWMLKCDRLLVVVEGKVVETGTVDELRAAGGAFAGMAAAGEWNGTT